MLPTIAELGFPSLTITYRNDAGALPSSDGFYRYGQTEWEELHGAAAYAIDQGAERLILVGYSMGGGIVMSFLYQSALADRVDAAILDAPMLSFSSAVEQGARQRGYPGLFTSLAKLFATTRFGIDWQRVDYLRRADDPRTERAHLGPKGAAAAGHVFPQGDRGRDEFYFVLAAVK